MSDEEKKSYDNLIMLKYFTVEKEDKQVIDTILNLIEKQSKEIEELKTDRDKFKKALGKRITYCNELEKDLFENCNNYVVSKDKIKAKVIEIKNRPVKDEFITVTQGKLNTIIEIESLLEKE